VQGAAADRLGETDGQLALLNKSWTDFTAGLGESIATAGLFHDAVAGMVTVLQYFTGEVKSMKEQLAEGGTPEDVARRAAFRTNQGVIGAGLGFAGDLLTDQFNTPGQLVLGLIDVVQGDFDALTTDMRGTVKRRYDEVMAKADELKRRMDEAAKKITISSAVSVGKQGTTEALGYRPRDQVIESAFTAASAEAYKKAFETHTELTPAMYAEIRKQITEAVDKSIHDSETERMKRESDESFASSNRMWEASQAKRVANETQYAEHVIDAYQRVRAEFGHLQATLEASNPFIDLFVKAQEAAEDLERTFHGVSQKVLKEMMDIKMQGFVGELIDRRFDTARQANDLRQAARDLRRDARGGQPIIGGGFVGDQYLQRGIPQQNAALSTADQARLANAREDLVVAQRVFEQNKGLNLQASQAALDRAIQSAIKDSGLDTSKLPNDLKELLAQTYDRQQQQLEQAEAKAEQRLQQELQSRSANTAELKRVADAIERGGYVRVDINGLNGSASVTPLAGPSSR
jgi:hypothetical protein